MPTHAARRQFRKAGAVKQRQVSLFPPFELPSLASAQASTIERKNDSALKRNPVALSFLKRQSWFRYSSVAARGRT